MPRETVVTRARGRARADAVEPVPRDWAVAAIAAVGILLSAYLTWTKLAGATALFCEAGTACDIVQGSRYATFLWLPTAAWGVILYATVMALALWGLTPKRWLLTFALAAAALGFSAYLTYLQIWVLRAVCPWCVADAGIAAALVGALLWRRPEVRGRRSPVRPVRVAVTGVGMAVATIVLAVGVHVGDSPTAGVAYREDLARHLAATGAIFYGAYW